MKTNPYEFDTFVYDNRDGFARVEFDYPGIDRINAFRILISFEELEEQYQKAFPEKGPEAFWRDREDRKDQVDLWVIALIEAKIMNLNAPEMDYKVRYDFKKKEVEDLKKEVEELRAFKAAHLIKEKVVELYHSNGTARYKKQA